VATRIKLAGGSTAQVFTREAVEQIHEISRGVPRTINVIADNALLNGLALNQKPVRRQTVQEVCRDLDLAHDPHHEVVPLSASGGIS
jgi:general secretion pathway protein A